MTSVDGKSMSYLALDLSKKSTGWAQWKPGWEKPIFGHFTVGSSHSTVGQVCAALHRELAAIHTVTPVKYGIIEKPLTAAQIKGNTDAETLFMLAALAGHAHSFAYAMGWRGQHVTEVNISSWRRHFLGSQKRGTKSATWKRLAEERCRQFGWSPHKDDEADALGILDYALHLPGIGIAETPPWRAAETLQPMGEVAR